MRITMTAPLLDGGIGRNILNLATSWLGMGLSVDLVLDEHGGPYVAQLPAGVTVFESGDSHPITKVPWLAQYIRRREPQAILTPVPRHTVWALRARRFSGPKPAVVANVHNNYEMTLAAVRARKRRTRIALLRRHYSRCDRIIPVSEGAALAFARLTGIARERLTPIPNPVVTPDLIRLAASDTDHPWLQGDGPPVIISVGRLEPQKNVQLLLEAFDRLRAARPCRLIIVGGGSELQRLQSQARLLCAADDVDLVGYQDNPYRFLRRASVFALPSRWEGFGNVLVEALALGVPVVACDCPSGPAEILDGGRLGPLVPVDDSAALAAGIARCLDDPVSSSVLIDAAGRYSADEIARQYLSVLAGVGPSNNGT